MVSLRLRRAGRIRACAFTFAIVSAGAARAQTPPDAEVCMTPDLVQAVLQASNEANGKDGKVLTGVTNGKVSARSQSGLTCTYDGVMKVTDGTGAREVKVVVTGRVTTSADGTDLDTHVEPAK